MDGEREGERERFNLRIIIIRAHSVCPKLTFNG